MSYPYCGFGYESLLGLYLSYKPDSLSGWFNWLIRYEMSELIASDGTLPSELNDWVIIIDDYIIQHSDNVSNCPLQNTFKVLLASYWFEIITFSGAPFA